MQLHYHELGHKRDRKSGRIFHRVVDGTHGLNAKARAVHVDSAVTILSLVYIATEDAKVQRCYCGYGSGTRFVSVRHLTPTENCLYRMHCWLRVVAARSLE
jgi:uncharacterized repeat protein (TIGR04076 family)